MEKLLVDSLVKLFERDLTKLEEEIKQYTNESTLWKVDGQIKNSAGNLCLHLCGNLQHYIGKGIGNNTYIRNRDLEFAAKNVAREKLVEQIQQTKQTVVTTLRQIDVATLDKLYPEEVWGYPITTLYFLIHLATHLTYHLGQINYHRRLING